MPAAAPLELVAAALEVVVDPEEPDVPDDPEEPDVPDVPEEPDEPGDPEEPDVPEELLPPPLPLPLDEVALGEAAELVVDITAFTGGHVRLNLGVVERSSVMAN